MEEVLHIWLRHWSSCAKPAVPAVNEKELPRQSPAIPKPDLSSLISNLIFVDVHRLRSWRSPVLPIPQRVIVMSPAQLTTKNFAKRRSSIGATKSGDKSPHSKSG